MKPLTLQEAQNKGYYTYSFSNGDYAYQVNEIEHLIRNGKEIATATFVWSYNNGDYMCRNEVRHEFNKYGKEI